MVIHITLFFLIQKVGFKLTSMILMWHIRNLCSTQLLTSTSSSKCKREENKAGIARREEAADKGSGS